MNMDNTTPAGKTASTLNGPIAAASLTGNTSPADATGWKWSGRTLSAGLLIGLLTLSGCASNPPANVFMRGENQYETIGQGQTRAQARDRALQTAGRTCQRRGGQVMVISDEIRYNGVLSEQASRVVTDVSKVVGSLARIRPPSLARDDDYEMVLKFSCRAG